MSTLLARFNKEIDCAIMLVNLEKIIFDSFVKENKAKSVNQDSFSTNVDPKIKKFIFICSQLKTMSKIRFPTDKRQRPK